MAAAQQLVQQLQNPLVTGRRRRWIGSGSNYHSIRIPGRSVCQPALSIQEHVARAAEVEDALHRI